MFSFLTKKLVNETGHCYKVSSKNYWNGKLMRSQVYPLYSTANTYKSYRALWLKLMFYRCSSGQSIVIPNVPVSNRHDSLSDSEMVNQYNINTVNFSNAVSSLITKDRQLSFYTFQLYKKYTTELVILFTADTSINKNFIIHIHIGKELNRN